MALDLKQYLQGNTYPGRGILLGRCAHGRHAVIAYFIMGRSTNSRNRVFVEDGDGIRRSRQTDRPDAQRRIDRVEHRGADGGASRRQIVEGIERQCVA